MTSEPCKRTAIYRRTLKEVLVDNTTVFLGDNHIARKTLRMLAGESVRKASSANRRVYALREDGRTSLATNAGSQPSVSEYIHPTQYPSIRTDPSRRPFPPPPQRQPIPRLSVYTHRDCYFEGERRVFGVVDTNLRL